jgi:cephalosporin hydroxylase
MTDDTRQFHERNQSMIETMAHDSAFQDTNRLWFNQSFQYEYSYHFTWMGLPIIQYPQDMVAMQEVIWKVKPDLIIETGIARGGSLIFYASMLAMMGLEGEVIGIDVDIRSHNRQAIEAHPMFKHITMFEGSSVDEAIVQQVRDKAAGKQRVIVILDSNHTHEHVLQELQQYSPLVTKESYLVVFDTVINDMPAQLLGNRPWTPDHNPKTAVYEFLKTNDRFEIDNSIHQKLLITVAPDGYLHCVK